MHGIKALLARIKSWFKRSKLKSTEQVHWINHIYDETVTWPNKALMWCNVHGFDEGPGATYWVGMDIRSFGIRAADYIVKCKNKSTYDKWIDKASNDMEHVLSALKSDPELRVINGDDVNVEFIFRWGDEEKTFNVHLGVDWYAEEI